MGFREAVSPEVLLTNRRVTSLTFEKNTKQLYNDHLCLVKIAALLFRGNRILEKKASKTFVLDLNIVDGNFSDELSRPFVQKHDKAVRLLRYNNHKNRTTDE